MFWTACDDLRGRLDGTLLKDRAIVGVIIIVSLFGFKIYQNFSRNDLTNVDIESIITTAEQSFIKAGAAGKIVQGDGHVSDCPYHKKQNR
mgnify:CR=1 FL=1|tara:strand:+ start:668 stop:937 length:270 start_codon:yes stop_codon:yes gene_type:complete